MSAKKRQQAAAFKNTVAKRNASSSGIPAKPTSSTRIAPNVVVSQPTVAASFMKKSATKVSTADLLEDTTKSVTQGTSDLSIVRKPMGRRQYPKGVILGLHFTISTTEEIRGRDKCHVTEPVLAAQSHAVCDTKMGATVDFDCSTCGRNSERCTGHTGYIDLPWPVYNPAFIKSILKVCRLFCLTHYRQYKRELLREYLSLSKTNRSHEDGTKFSKDDYIRLAEESLKERQVEKIMPCFDPDQPERDFPDIYGNWRLQLIENHRGCDKCVNNKEKVYYTIKREFYIEERIGKVEDGKVALLDPYEVLNFFEAIDDDPRGWARILGFGSNKLSSMINVVWPVMSNIQRLDIKTAEKTMPNPLSKIYVEIVKYSKLLKDMKTARSAKVGSESREMNPISKHMSSITFTEMQDLTYVEGDGTKRAEKDIKGHDVYHNMCAAIKALVYDKDDPDKGAPGGRDNQTMSITTLVNGKPGLLRKDVMGKGSDHGGRTVIIGDNSIDIDEVGLSRVFVDVLTIPEVLETEADVVKWTAEMPRVENGKKISGLVRKVVKMSNGSENNIEIGEDTVVNLQVGDIVRRKVVNGDIIVIQRQPVLHKGGLMGFKVRIFDEGGNVMRLHPAVAGPFNADFDGDEMNFSVPQDLESRREVASKMMIGNCVRGDKYSTPWVGMIQNPVVAATQMTQPGVVIENGLAKRIINIGLETFRRRNPGGVFRTDTKAYYEDLYSLKYNLDPSSGHALLSFFMPINFKYERRRGEGKDPVIVENGYLLSGVMDKQDVGKASNGMVDTILDMYGSETVIVFISALNRALYEFIEADGFTIGIKDCVLPNLPDGTNPQDNIDNLIAETFERVVDLLEKGQQSGYLAQQAEAEADKMLAALGDRINAIVIAGGVDAPALTAKINAERTSNSLHEILEVALQLNMMYEFGLESADILTEMGVMMEGQEGFSKAIAKVLKTIKDGKRPKDKNRFYNEEMHVLRCVASAYRQHGLQDVNFNDIALVMIRPDNLIAEVVRKLEEAANLRSDLIGAAKFNNRLLTAVYSGARGTSSNVMQALGMVGPQEKSFIGRDETMQRSLPFHKQGELNPVATHFCSSSFSKGLNEYEYWNHASATRANIITSNLMPSVTGFFYRRAVCLGMDIYAEEDGSSRDENGRIVQFMYGGDGFDATRLTNVDKKTTPQFINAAAVAKNLRTDDGLSEYVTK